MIHANTAAVGRLSLRAAERMQAAIRNHTENEFYTRHYPRNDATLNEVRALSSALLGVDSNNIALTTSTSDGMAMFEGAMGLRPGDVVAINPGSFISVRASLIRLQASGVKIVNIGDENGRVRVPDLCNTPANTKLIILDWVNYWSGHRNDLHSLSSWCRNTNIPLLIDGVQGLGAVRIDFDLENVAGFACGGHKWLRGPEGTGILYIAPWMLHRLSPQHAGYRSLANSNDLEAKQLQIATDARSFEVGTLNAIGFHGLAGALREILDLGIASTAHAIADNASRLAAMLGSIPGIKTATPIDPKERSGIISFKHIDRSSAGIVHSLLDNGVTVGLRRGWVRLSPDHTVNIDRLLRTISNVLGSSQPRTLLRAQCRSESERSQ